MLKGLWVGLLGVVLLLPAALYWACIWISDPVRPADVRTAFQRLASVPLSQAAGDLGVEVTATIPNDASWMRIIRNWGDPGYLIGAVAPGPRHYMYCLKDLGVRVEVRIGDQLVGLETAGVPYGYSIDCEPAGLIFRAPPGAVVKIRLAVTGQPRQAVDLVVQPYWRGEVKDHLVGVYIDEDLHIQALVSTSGAAGILAIAFAAFLFSHRPAQPSG